MNDELFEKLAGQAKEYTVTMRLENPISEEELAEFEEGRKNSTIEAYPQDQEENEYRYISPAWLDMVARGLTAGAVKHPGETWRQIPAREHAARALRHLNLYLMGDKADDHLVNASMRCMMAFEMAIAEDQREGWEKLMRDSEMGRL